MQQERLVKGKAGVTLVALVITIVILLILAGVSIGTLTGENGIIEKAIEAKEGQVIAMEIEQIEITYLMCKINKSKEGNKITDADLREELIKQQHDVDTSSSETSDGYFIYVTFNNSKRTYVIDEDGNVKHVVSGQFDTSKIDQKMVKQEISFQDSIATIRNPDRGWYRPVTIQLGSNVDIQTQCASAIKENIQLLHLRVNIGQLSGNVNADGVDKDFTPEQLSSLNSILDTIRKNRLNVIIRFAYDLDGNTGKEPKSFDTIKKHIGQLSSFFDSNKDIISTVEAGFLGPWGEMHSAGIYQADNYYKILTETLLENTPRDMKINVRKPYFFKLVVGDLNDSQHRLGIFNDGYLGSLTDLGTFDNGISREDFVKWMETQGQYTMYGGEVTKSGLEGDEKYNDSKFALEEMPKTHTTYLNSQFNLQVLDTKWKNQNYTSSDSEYNGQTAYKYITDHLGYRMVVRDSKISSSVEKGDICGVNLELENVGFGNIIKTQKVSVILRKNLEYYETTLDINANNIKSGEKSNVNFYFYIPSDIEAGDWQVYLKISNEARSDYAIQFANPNMWDEDLLANCIGKVTIENSVAKEGINIRQAFSMKATDGYKGQIAEKVVTIPVTIGFYREGVNEPITSKQFNLELGTIINFTDANVLSSLNIQLPNGYRFKGAQCYAITNDWAYHNSITIPNSTNEQSYWINVFVE
ncbi:MAG: DUF4832 domain-containing protein [Clostridia bacterium]|nr:DUF4832 domain-containing protein [Clostridia bacterium]MCI9413116.1 DUF4832 domain-containing protein [Clostridia bacterium]